MSDWVTRIYQGFRGVDFRGGELSLSRSPDSLNVWRDHKQADGICTRPGMLLLTDMNAPVRGIWFFRGIMLVQCGTALYTVSDGVPSLLYEGVSDSPASAFMYDDIWYFLDGQRYLCYDGTAIRQVEGYVPTTSIGRKPSGGGTKHEDVNMLSDFRINTFCADGESTEFYLDYMNISSVSEVLINDVSAAVDSYTVDCSRGMVCFTEAPQAPEAEGQDNVSITYRKQVPEHRRAIERCRLLQVFDNRVFVSGNPDFPNVVWHCMLQDPTYFSDLDYYREGMDASEIRGLVAGNNALWVFRRPSEANTNVFYHTPSIDSEYGKVYPSVHSSIALGCCGRAINFEDDIVFFSPRGMEGISGDVTTEQVASHRSTLIDSKLTAAEDYENMILCEWEGYLLVLIGRQCFLADSRAVFSHEGHAEYEWFYWDMERPICSALVYDGILYLGTADGIYTLTDREASLHSYWTTPKDKFGAPSQQKTTNKRGCVVESGGDVTVSVKTEDTEWEQVESYEGITDSFVCQIKRKKFKDIQVKFESSTRFRLESATLECFVGGYLK